MTNAADADAPVLPMLAHTGALVLHISDLHISRKDVRSKSEGTGLGALRVQTDLWRELWSASDGDKPINEVANFCIVTGDLAESSPDRVVYGAIRHDLEYLFEDDRWRVVPGNHDRRWWGNFSPTTAVASRFEQEFREWRSPLWDLDAPLIVVPLDSCPSSETSISWAITMARGVVTPSEMDRLEQALRDVEVQIFDALKERVDSLSDEDLARRGRCLASAFSGQQLEMLRDVSIGGTPLGADARCELVDVLARVLACLHRARAVVIAMVHHHPIGIAGTENLGLTHQDAYLAMLNAGEFLKKCRELRVSIVCHGHKHMPHRTAVGIPGDGRLLGIAGAGSTTRRSKVGATSGNLIEIFQSGAADVRRFDIGNANVGKVESDGFGPAGRGIRPWSSVRRQMFDAALRTSRYACDRVSQHVRILSSGDGVATRSIEGMRLCQHPGTPRPWLDNSSIVFPLAAALGAQTPRPTVTVREVGGRQDYVGAPYVQTLRQANGEWQGFVAIPFSGDPYLLRFDIAVQFLARAAFATNGWQSALRPGLDGAGSDHYRSVCSFPVERSLHMSLAFSGAFDVAGRPPSFEEPRLLHQRLDGSHDSHEAGDMALIRAPGNDVLSVVVNEPVWGSKYGVAWRLFDAGLDERCERRRRELWTELRTKPGNRIQTALTSIFKDAEELKGLECCIHLIVLPGMQAASKSAQLHPLAWNDCVQHAGRHDVVLDAGAGVAGYAAWLGEGICWADDAPETTSLYLPLDGSSHVAVVALPLYHPAAPGSPLAVLSVSDAGGAGARDELRSVPSWLWSLHERVQSLCAGS